MGIVIETADVNMLDSSMEEVIQAYLEGSKKTVEYKLCHKEKLNSEWYHNVYEQLNKINNLVYVRVKSGEKVVGFAIIELSQHSHYDFQTAMFNSIFLLGEYRHNGNGKALLDFCFRLAKRKGAKAFYLIAPHGSKLEKVYSREFTQTDSLFIKEL